LEGKIFEMDLNPRHPFTFRLGRGEVIPGWDQIFQLMRPGSTWMVIIPPELAYGSRGRVPRVPPDTTLVFDIQLIGVAREQ
jgi:peptidylprolyl isomerase